MQLIPRLKQGESYPTAFSAEFMNKIIDVCNSVLMMQGKNGITVFNSGKQIILVGSNVTGSSSSGSFGSGSSSTTGVGDVWL